ncbi:MAG: hypothetical protein HC892_01605 [Saprospiraceae bacterium]|nr:hypothetical protein [Saprospiraceae bacterium]
MYGSLYFADANNIEDAQIVASYKAPKGSVNRKLIDKINNLRSGGFGINLVKKNTFIVRGGIIGAVIFAGMAMYFKKNILGSAIIGVSVGSVGGFAYSKIVSKQNDIKQNK